MLRGALRDEKAFLSCIGTLVNESSQIKFQMTLFYIKFQHIMESFSV